MRMIVLLIGFLSTPLNLLAQPSVPTDNPVAKYKLAWTDDLNWKRAVNVHDFKKTTWDKAVRDGQESLGSAGGVLYFPPGDYAFSNHIQLQENVILRGADPAKETDARRDGFHLGTRFEFPKYVPKFVGEGSAIESAFKGIHLANPESASNCGIIHIDINRGHIALGESPEKKCGRNRIVFGCILRNAAVADPGIPNLKIGQHPWQRHTLRHHAAVNVHTAENALIANNRLPPSGDDNFLQKGYVLLDPKKKKLAVEEGVVFDYDNRPGIYANDFGIGAGGGNGPAGTPETHPWGFRKGLVIRDNYLFHTGRCAISFTGDGVYCGHNVIRFKPGVKRWTVTGDRGVTGSGTNDNRAVQMRGYRWTVEGNDYEVYSNTAAFGGYRINDGEGLMHEAHVNSAIKDSKLLNNKGNAYLSLYKAHGIDGLLISGNTVNAPKGIDAIFVSANYNGKYFPIRNVSIEKNKTSGTGILVDGKPAQNILIRDNHHTGAGGFLRIFAEARLAGNEGYETKKK